jgi:DNA-binding transcriptional LysR family regulator
MLETSLLQTLISVSENSNFSQAAKDLGITQSAISQNIKKIEKKTNFSIVTKQGKSVTLTAEGRRLASFAKQYFQEFDLTVNSILQDQNKMSGRLKIGTLMGLGKTWLAPHVLSFSNEFPLVEIKLMMDFTQNLLNQFESKHLDILVLPKSFIPANVDRKVLGEEHFTLVFPKDDKFNIGPDTELKDLSEFPLILFQEKDPLFFDWCRKMYNATPRTIKSRIIVNSFSHMFEAVAMGLGIAVIPIHVVNRYMMFYQEKVAMLSQHLTSMEDPICFVHHQGADEQVKIKTLFERLKLSLNNDQTIS